MHAGVIISHIQQIADSNLRDLPKLCRLKEMSSYLRGISISVIRTWPSAPHADLKQTATEVLCTIVNFFVFNFIHKISVFISFKYCLKYFILALLVSHYSRKKTLLFCRQFFFRILTDILDPDPNWIHFQWPCLDLDRGTYNIF